MATLNKVLEISAYPTIVTYAQELDISLDALVRDSAPGWGPYCIENFFTGMSESLATKYLRLCEAADLLPED